MALLYYSGFETIPSGNGTEFVDNIQAQGWSLNLPSANRQNFPEFQQGVRTGRYPEGQCLVMPNTANVAGSVFRQFTGADATLSFAQALTRGGITLGFAARNQSTASSTVLGTFFGFGRMFSSLPSVLSRIGNTGTGYSLSIPSGTSTLGVTVTSFNEAGRWYYYELVHEALSASTYVFRLYRDSELLYQSGTITINTGAAVMTSPLALMYYSAIGGVAASASPSDFMFDDIYVIDRTGDHTSVDRLGQVREYRVGPTSDVQAQWSKQGSAASNALTVNKLDYKDNTSYVYSQTAGNTDVYNAPGTVDLPTGGKVVAVAVETFASRGLQARTIQTSIVSGSSRSDSPEVALPTATSYVKHFTTTDPDTGAEWTIEAANAANLRTTLVS